MTDGLASNTAFLRLHLLVAYAWAMHEMSFAEQILECIIREAGAYPDARVVRVRLRAGEALALEPASLRFCLEAISVDTVMNGARIEMVEDGELGSELIVEEIEIDEEDTQGGGEGTSEGA